MQTADQVNLTDATDEDADHDFCSSCSEWLPIADTDEDGLCQKCHDEAVAEAEAEAAAEAKQEAIDAVQGEVDETQDELESLLDQMKELQAEIAEKRATLKAAKKRLAKLEA